MVISLDFQPLDLLLLCILFLDLALIQQGRYSNHPFGLHVLRELLFLLVGFSHLHRL